MKFVIMANNQPHCIVEGENLTINDAEVFAKSLQRLSETNKEHTKKHGIPAVYFRAVDVPVLYPEEENVSDKRGYLEGLVVPLGYVIRHMISPDLIGDEVYRAVANHQDKASATMESLETWCDQVGEDIAKGMGIPYKGHILGENEDIGV